MLIERLGQGIAKTRTTDVETMTKRTQRIADPARRRRFLMQDDQNR
jgi:hypothetical protein